LVFSLPGGANIAGIDHHTGYCGPFASEVDGVAGQTFPAVQVLVLVPTVLLAGEWPSVLGASPRDI
jgi:hypothetical protein